MNTLTWDLDPKFDFRHEHRVHPDKRVSLTTFPTQFEELLVQRGTRILKFYLHVSPAEQLERFKVRLDDPSKHWKLNAGDYATRSKWGDYHEAYEDVFEKCNSKHAPWYIIPADKKWYRDASVAAILRQTFQNMDPQLPAVEVNIEKIRRLYDEEATSESRSP